MSGVYHSPQQRLPKPGWFTPAGSIKAHFFIPRVGDSGVATSLCLKQRERYAGVTKPPRFDDRAPTSADCKACLRRLRQLPAGRRL